MMKTNGRGYSEFYLRPFYIEKSKLTFIQNKQMSKLIYQSVIVTLLIVLCGCNSNNHKSDLEANREIVRKYHQVWSEPPGIRIRHNNVSGLCMPFY